MVADAAWDLSLKEVPYYLISQFGKLQLAEVVKQLLAELSGQQAQLALDTVAYWLAPATEGLLGISRTSWNEGRSGIGKADPAEFECCFCGVKTKDPCTVLVLLGEDDQAVWAHAGCLRRVVKPGVALLIPEDCEHRD